MLHIICLFIIIHLCPLAMTVLDITVWNSSCVPTYAQFNRDVFITYWYVRGRSTEHS